MGEGVFDDDSKPIINYLQMLHGAYNIQNWQEDDEIKHLCSHLQDNVTNEKFKKLENLIMTRWWLVGACACSFKEIIITWRKIFQSIQNSAKSGLATSKITSCTLNFMDSKCIINDLHLLCAFHNFYLPILQILAAWGRQSIEHSKFPSKARNCSLFLILEDLLTIEDYWEREEGFSEYASTMNELINEDEVVQNKVHSLP